MDLNELSKKDKYWRNVAFYYCKDKMLADDIVQDMYLKMININRNIEDWYIRISIKNLWIDYCRKQSKKVKMLVRLDSHSKGNGKKYISDNPLTNLDVIKSNESTFEPNDEELELLLRADNIKYHQREFLEENYDNSIRKIGEKYKVNYGFVYQELKKAKEYIRHDIKKRDYKLTTKITDTNK